MNKEERIAKYGEAAYKKKLEQVRAWQEEHKEEEKAYSKKYYKEHKEEENARSKKYREKNPEQVVANGQEQGRRGGKHYAKKLKYEHTGLQGARNRIRYKHGREWKPYKDIIAPDSQIHHEWVPDTAEYRGIALVEAEQHMHGIIDVIEILDGKITLLTEEQVRKVRREPEGL